MPRFCLTIFTVTFLLLLTLVGAMGRMWSLPKETTVVASAAEQPGQDCYLSTDNRTTLDQLVFHHGLENVAPGLSNADVVFVGNSRSLCAFPAQTCLPWFESRNLKWYHAGFPAESNVFTQHILESYNVRPKLVVVNADNFFTGKISAIARRSVDTTTFGAEKQYWESRLSFRVRQQLHAWLPHPPSQFFAQESMVVHRSLNNGSWFVADAKGQRSDVPSDEDLPPDAQPTEEPVRSERIRTEHIEIAAEFKRFVNDRGGELMITYIPAMSNDRIEAQQLADALGCRFIAPQLDGLKTFDGSHLDTASAVRFSNAFLAELASQRIALASP